MWFITLRFITECVYTKHDSLKVTQRGIEYICTKEQTSQITEGYPHTATISEPTNKIGARTPRTTSVSIKTAVTPDPGASYMGSRSTRSYAREENHIHIEGNEQEIKQNHIY